MAWLPKCLLHKHQDLKPEPEHVQKARHMPIAPVLGPGFRQSVDFGFSDRPSLQK